MAKPKNKRSPTFDDLTRRLQSGESVVRRRCTVCGEPILYGLRPIDRMPVLFSCPTCRPERSSNIVDLTWHELAVLWENS